MEGTKFQKRGKPESAVIDAIQYTGGRQNIADIREVSGLNFSVGEDERFKLHLQGVDTIIEKGDFVAKSGQNVFVVRAQDFHKLYETYVEPEPEKLKKDEKKA